MENSLLRHRHHHEQSGIAPYIVIPLAGVVIGRLRKNWFPIVQPLPDGCLVSLSDRVALHQYLLSPSDELGAPITMKYVVSFARSQPEPEQVYV